MEFINASRTALCKGVSSSLCTPTIRNGLGKSKVILGNTCLFSSFPINDTSYQISQESFVFHLVPHMTFIFELEHCSIPVQRINVYIPHVIILHQTAIISIIERIANPPFGLGLSLPPANPSWLRTFDAAKLLKI